MRVEFELLRAIAGVGTLPSRPAAADPALAIADTRERPLTAAGRLGVRSRADGPTDAGIAAIQSALRMLDAGPASASLAAASGAPTGVFNEATADALKAFQHRACLAPTGVLDAATLHRLDNALVGGLDEVDVWRGGEALAVKASAAVGNLPVVTRQDGNKFFARVGDSPEFIVGRRVSYLGRIGLTNSLTHGGPRYVAADQVAAWGHWATLIEPSAICEGGGFFDRLNTYDRARFTFGFLQDAAHEPESDFVQLLRRLLTLPLAPGYFPDLTLMDGRIAHIVGGHPTPLETSHSTTALMDYFNPDPKSIEEHEVVNCAKLVHWCAQDPMHRGAQVEVGVAAVRKALPLHHKRYNLDGRSDVTCLLIFDIHHQGRATVKAVRTAIDSAATEEAAWDELLSIGLPDYAERLTTLRKQVTGGLASGVFGRRRYVAASNEFVES